MPSELEGFIFSFFLGENRILGCLGGILEASWVVLAEFLGLSWPPTWAPRRAQDGPKTAQDASKTAQDASKTAQDG